MSEEKKVEAKKVTVKLKAPEGATACSVGGEEFAVKNGCVDVDPAYMDHLAQHGYTLAPADAPKK